VKEGVKLETWLAIEAAGADHHQFRLNKAA
jgi:hypothetical protein